MSQIYKALLVCVAIPLMACEKQENFNFLYNDDVFHQIEKALQVDDGVINLNALSDDDGWNKVCLITPYSKPEKDLKNHVNNIEVFDNRIFDDVFEDFWGIGLLFLRNGEVIELVRIPAAFYPVSESKGSIIDSMTITNDGKRYLSSMIYKRKSKEDTKVCFPMETTIQISREWAFTVIGKEGGE